PEGGLGPAHDRGSGHVAFRDQQPQRCADAVHPDVVPSFGTRPGTVGRAEGGGEGGADEPVPPARVERRSRQPDNPLRCSRPLFVSGGGQDDLASARGASGGLSLRTGRRTGPGEGKNGADSRRRDARGRIESECPIRRRCGTSPHGRPSCRGTFSMKIEQCEFPDDLLYDPEGLVWARPLESGEIVVGITSIHAALAGPVLKVSAKPLTASYDQHAAIGFLESGKYFGPIRSPVGGVLREVNAAVLAKLNELLTRIEVGTVVHLVTDDPTSPIEMVRWSDQTGQPVIDERKEGNLFHFLVRKVP